MKVKHKPHSLAKSHKFNIRWSEDFECFIKVARPFDTLPNSFYLGERTIYLTPGFDCRRANFRGNCSDDWPCIDFGKDFKEALEWLHNAEDSKRRTRSLWTSGKVKK